MRTPVAFCLLAVAVAVGGCGGGGARDSAEDYDGAERAVAAAVEEIETAAREKDPAKVCEELLSDGLLAALEKKGTNCRTGIEEGFDDADSLELKVDDVKISGDTATAKVTSGRAGSKQKQDTLNLELDGKAWKITSLGAPASG